MFGEKGGDEPRQLEGPFKQILRNEDVLFGGFDVHAKRRRNGVAGKK